jgi:hypothetical protein
MTCIFPDPLQMYHACQRFGTAAKPSRFAHVWQGAESLVLATQNTLQRPKMVRACGVFLPFDFEMCFAPKRRANFHLSSRQMAPHEPLQ